MIGDLVVLFLFASGMACRCLVPLISVSSYGFSGYVCSRSPKYGII